MKLGAARLQQEPGTAPGQILRGSGGRARKRRRSVAVGAATAAIEALNGKDWKGRALTVNEARPREERSGGGGRRGYGGGRRDRY